MRQRINLSTIDSIKQAVDSGEAVKCDNGHYSVYKSTGGNYYIKFDHSDYIIGLHGMQGTKYADQLNGRNFHYYSD